MRYLSDKKIKEVIKKSKVWDHDIKYVEGRFIEDVVTEYQQTGSEDLLHKILNNYLIFRSTWGRAFAQYCDSQDVGEMLHDQIIWKAAKGFNTAKCEKQKGSAFNAYYVSACLNQRKNLRSAHEAAKAHPYIKCPICQEEVYQLTEQHLSHVIDLERYKRMFPRYPLVSVDGAVRCPVSGKMVDEITEWHLNKENGRYTVDDFKQEYANALPKGPFKCPVTGIKLSQVSSAYPSQIMAGYTEADFIKDFPNFEGLVRCPFTGTKKLEISQQHLDSVLRQKKSAQRYSQATFIKEFPNATISALQVKVKNPYTGRMVAEITPEMLEEAGTTIRKHLEDHAQIWLEKYYPDGIRCPFTGKSTRKITRKHLESIGKTTYDFYNAVCKYPLKKWHVKCAICGEFVENVWSHLLEKEHTYATRVSIEDFEQAYSGKARKAKVSTNAYLTNDSGDVVHVADLLPAKIHNVPPMDVEDSLIAVAQSEDEMRIAKAVRHAKTMDDVAFLAAKRVPIQLRAAFKESDGKLLRGTVAQQMEKDETMKDYAERDDFDVVAPEVGATTVEVAMPCIDTIRATLVKMIEISDLC
jgi:uncharacterized Zn finger protein (UPF0148 family)